MDLEERREVIRKKNEAVEKLNDNSDLKERIAKLIEILPDLEEE